MDINLGRREKLWLALGAALLLPLIIFRFVVTPLNEYQNKMEQKIISIQEKTRQINLLGQELLHLKTQETPSYPLKRKINSILRKVRFKENPTLNSEENPDGDQKLILKLRRINLTQLLKTIYGIENATPVILIDKIDISREYDNDKLFRVSLYLRAR